MVEYLHGGGGGGGGVQYHRHQHSSIHCMSVEIGLNTDFTRLCYLEIGLVFWSHKHESSDEWEYFIHVQHNIVCLQRVCHCSER